ncbi:sialidase family protein [Schaalia odontolytica]|uniref:exo-alpha-sialidase n=2 Tax=Schaalia odontolytica TaxID=1660 RepID=A0A857A5A8_9ACTO|nr:sialidase family protein [Schaalia odontolytica]EFF79994.1 BNR/Asp-box repeat protein [Schaalia odontolytica F0309]QGS10500.1 sialidase [Schaalia odontolytica]
MSIDAGHPGISWTLQFRARIDGALIELHSTADTGWHLFIRSSALFLEGSTNAMSFALDMEDTASVTDGTWHSLAITATSAGSKIFLDGYQCFSTTADLSPAASGPEATLELTPGAGIDIRSFTEHDGVLSPAEILALSPAPTPLIEFAAARLSDYDVAELSELTAGTIFARYRVRGPGQHGTILAAGGGGTEQLNLSVTEEGIEYKVLGRRGEWRTFTAHGHWDQGHWHDVVVRVGHGAVQIYVDGYLEAHLPGQAFFAAVDSLDEVVIGQDTSGSRLFGEVRNAALYSSVLNDSQIKKLSSIAPVDTQCLFDAGFHDSISYRIPSLITLESGVVVAGADQRETIANDSPNSINFTVRRSFDGGHTWGDLQTVLTYPGHGAKGASVIDSCVVQDRRNGRLVILIDHFPGGIGQPNAEAGLGVDERGRYILHDANGATYTWNQDGSVTDADGNTTAFTVSERGDVTVTEGGQESSGGNVFLADGVDPHQTLLTARTCFLQMIYSDDDGETWSGPFNLNQDVKEEWMSFCGTSPGTGVQLRSGRLVIPIYYNGDHKRHFSASVVYSDDGGTTWKRGKSPNDGRIFEGREIDSRTLDTEAAATHEATLIERADGSLLMLMRNQHPSGKVAATVSTDGGETWSDVFFAEEITEIFCQPNAVPWPTEDCPERVVFANASQMRPYRGRGVLRLSEDGGRTWIASRTFNPAHYVYQCMTILPDGALGLLWEREMQGLYFSRIPLEWIEAAKI